MFYKKNIADYIIVNESIHHDSVEAHSHECSLGNYDFELAYVVEGEATHVIGEKRQKISKGSYIFIDYGVSHSYEIEDGKSLSLINFVFDYRAVDLTHKQIKSLADLAYYYAINPDMNTCSVRDDYIFTDDDGKVLELFKKTKRELHERMPGYHDLVKCGLLEILLGGFRIYFNRNKRKKYSPPIQFIVNYITDYYMLDTTLSELAEQLDMSIPYISKRFKEEVGMHFTEFLHKRRITESCRIISNTDDSIESIAECIGYSDSKKFREKFKEQMGVSPREYRKQIQMK